MMTIVTAVIQTITYNFMKKRYREECFLLSLVFHGTTAIFQDGEGAVMVLPYASFALTIGITLPIASQRNEG